jgi:hypothetical protein
MALIECSVRRRASWWLPVVDDELALKSARLLGLGADVINSIPLGHVGRGGLAVEEDDRDVLGLDLVDDDRHRRPIDRVDGQRGVALDEELVDLIVLRRLLVLAVDDVEVGLVLGARFDGAADVRHERVVEFVDHDRDLRLAGGGGRARARGGRAAALAAFAAEQDGGRHESEDGRRDIEISHVQNSSCLR